MFVKTIAFLSAAVLLGSTAMAVDYGKVKLACHRGENTIAPENTMAAYNLAWSMGDQYTETDIQLTKDGKVVICHDPDTFRTSGNKTKVVIKDATLDEIRKVDVGDGFTPIAKHYQIGALPHFRIVDKKGVVRYVLVGNDTLKAPELAKQLANEH